MRKVSMFIFLLAGLFICLSVIFKIKQKDNNYVVPTVSIQSLDHGEKMR